MIQGFNIKTIEDVDISNKRILLKVDWNILNLRDGKSLLDTRKVNDTIPTLKYLLKKGNKLICVSHISKTHGKDPKRSIKPVVNYVQTLIPNYKVIVVDDFLSPEGTGRINAQQNNEVIVLENIRYHPEEMKNDPEFVKKLSALGEIYVNDAFAANHRSSASVIGPEQYLPSYAGFSLKTEVESIGKAILNPEKPFTFIVGGAKISTKTELVRKVMMRADNIVLGGALANTFLKAQGHSIGKSLHEPDQLQTAHELVEKSAAANCNIILPLDVVVGDVEIDSVESSVCNIDDIPDDKAILDIGPQTIKKIHDIIMTSKTIVWNGPVGYFEKDAFRKGTDAIFASMIQNNSATTIIGGGDTLTAIKDKPGQELITHISIGGGAMLSFIEKGTMPGLEALVEAQSHS
jgi:phosphoglycerate kinase